MHDPAILPQPVLVRDWKPVFPTGTLRSVMLHWTAGDYRTTFPAYHFCVSGGPDVRIATTHVLQANMRDLRTGIAGAYAAHTAGRNSYAAGIALCAMAEATPADFGPFALTAEQVEGACIVAARLVRFYGIPIADVRTHAEAALDDGYFGAQSDELRWDIARLAPASGPLRPAEAAAVGARLRARVAELC